MLTTGPAASNPLVYGEYTNPFVLEDPRSASTPHIVDIVLNNNDPGKHPFHLHGHHFQVLARSGDDAGAFDAEKFGAKWKKTPMRRDTVLVRPGGWVVLRFVADNPGVWLFHCHIEWYVIISLFLSHKSKIQPVATILLT